MGVKTKLSIFTILMMLVIAFQNCSPRTAPVNFSNEASKTTRSADSGTPYEGKIYATLGNLCADGTEIHSRIVLKSASEGQLDRENCQDIAPVSLVAGDFQIDTASDSVIYNTQSFGYIGTGLVGITNFSVTNDINNFYYGYSYEGQPSWLQIYIDVDNNPATGFFHDGIGADYMIENDNVWKYSAAAGAPQSTWSWTSIVSANKNKTAPNISWSFPRSAIGSPSLMKVMAHTSLGAQSAIVTQIPK